MKKNLTRLLCCVLVALVACGAVFAITACQKDDKPSNTGSLIVNPGEQNEIISLFAGPSTTSSGTAVTEYTLTVKLNDDCPDSMKAIDWSIAWKNASSEWASGKVVTDYVTLTPTSDGALTAKVAKVAAFGEQIIVTATARVATDLKATATVDCLKSDPVAVVSGLTFGQEFSKPDMTFKTVGTIEPSLSGGEVYLKYCTGNFVFQFSAGNGKGILSDIASINDLLGTDNEYRCWFGYKKAKQGNIPIYMAGDDLDSSAISVDDFFSFNPNLSEDTKTEIKNSAAYKKAYNAALSYLTSKESITFSVHVKLTYNSVEISDSYINFSCKVNQGNASPLSTITSVAFVDPEIIF